MNRKTVLSFLSLSSLLSACSVEAPAPEKIEPAPNVAASSLVTYEGFAGPERVLYDQERDRYLVSNVNGDPTSEDGNGFISVLSPAGETTALRWIESGQNGVQLDAPKGLAVRNGTLYVADITRVRTFDIDSGAPTGEIAVPGSTYLNGLSAAPDGKIYLTDSGPPRGTLDAKGTEAIYVLEGGEAKLISDGTLGRPTSVTWTPSGVLVAPFGANELYRIDGRGKKQQSSELPLGGLAGVVSVGSWLFVSSWQASGIYRGRLDQKFELVLSEQDSPTDIGYDLQRNRLLVPHFTTDRVDVFQLE
ncbi:MAG TPA: hypothetical protein VER11_34945 [Polyangiaceae bacterium]|nr:hypothetical protein [Polyangiaceae bacterium]